MMYFSKLQIFLLLLTFSAIIACNNIAPDKDRRVLAKVFDKYLYLDELDGLVIPGTSPEDSIEIIKNNINLWVKKQLMLNKAEINLKSDLQDIEKKVEDYRSSLFIYEYKQEFIKQKLDTVVEDAETEQYYKQNTQSFVLTTPVVKAWVFVISKKHDNIHLFNRYFFASKIDSAKMTEYCKTTGSVFEKFQNLWVNYSELQKLVPVPETAPEILLKSNNKFQFQDSENYYFVLIKEYRLSGETQPLQFVRDQIKSIILNKRKITIIEELEQNIYQNAIEYKTFEIY